MNGIGSQETAELRSMGGDWDGRWVSGLGFDITARGLRTRRIVCGISVALDPKPLSS